MTLEDLKVMQAYPFELKIQKSLTKIMEWVNYFGVNGVYISFSGGKDSTVLLDLVRRVNPNILAVFCDTGLEYPEIKKFVNTFDNVKTIKPTMNFKQIIKTHGYPIISKEISHKICYARRAKERGDMKQYYKYLNGGDKYQNSQYKLSEKHHRMLEAPFLISDSCCYFMKKKPFRKFEKERNNAKPFIGILTGESRLRQTKYLQGGGCNAFSNKRQISTPLGFWTEQDILQYIKQFNLKIADCYGDIIESGEQLKTTKCDRTGCMFCLYGCHLENQPNRIQQLYHTHRNIYDYIIKSQENGGLGYADIMEYWGVPYKPQKTLF
jgi:3''-phosphoadenosine 5''-phosphosulfate sulfotransferase (PAPS reductase)/FAD synthetase and related enzymes